MSYGCRKAQGGEDACSCGGEVCRWGCSSLKMIFGSIFPLHLAFSIFLRLSIKTHRFTETPPPVCQFCLLLDAILGPLGFYQRNFNLNDTIAHGHRFVFYRALRHTLHQAHHLAVHLAFLLPYINPWRRPNSSMFHPNHKHQKRIEIIVIAYNLE